MATLQDLVDPAEGVLDQYTQFVSPDADARLVIKRGITQRRSPKPSDSEFFGRPLTPELVDTLRVTLDKNPIDGILGNDAFVVATAIRTLAGRGGIENFEQMDIPLQKLEWAASATMSSFPTLQPGFPLGYQVFYDWVTWRQRGSHLWPQPSLELAGADLGSVERVLSNNAGDQFNKNTLTEFLRAYVDLAENDEEATRFAHDAAVIRQLLREMHLTYPEIPRIRPARGVFGDAFTLEQWLHRIPNDPSDRAESLDSIIALREVFQSIPPYGGFPPQNIPFMSNTELGLDPDMRPVLDTARGLYLAVHGNSSEARRIDRLVERAALRQLADMPWVAQRTLVGQSSDPATATATTGSRDRGLDIGLSRRIQERLAGRDGDSAAEEATPSLGHEDAARAMAAIAGSTAGNRVAKSAAESGSAPLVDGIEGRRYVTVGGALMLFDMAVRQRGWAPPGRLQTGLPLLSHVSRQDGWPAPVEFHSRPLDIPLDPENVFNAFRLDEFQAIQALIESPGLDTPARRRAHFERRIVPLVRFLAYTQRAVDENILSPRLYDDPLGLRALENGGTPTALQVVTGGVWNAALRPTEFNAEEASRAAVAMRLIFRDRAIREYEDPSLVPGWLRNADDSETLLLELARGFERSAELLTEAPAVIATMDRLSVVWPDFIDPFSIREDSQPLGIHVLKAIEESNVEGGMNKPHLRACAVKGLSALGPDWMSSPLDQQQLERLEHLVRGGATQLSGTELRSFSAVMTAFHEFTGVPIPASLDDTRVAVLGHDVESSLPVSRLFRGDESGDVPSGLLRTLARGAQTPGESASLADAMVSPDFIQHVIRRTAAQFVSSTERSRELFQFVSTLSQNMRPYSKQQVDRFLGLVADGDEPPTALQWVVGAMHAGERIELSERSTMRVGARMIDAFEGQYGANWMDARPNGREMVALLGNYVNGSNVNQRSYVEFAFIRGAQDAARYCGWGHPFHVHRPPVYGIDLVLTEIDHWYRSNLTKEQLGNALSSLRRVMGDAFGDGNWRTQKISADPDAPDIESVLELPPAMERRERDEAALAGPDLELIEGGVGRLLENGA